MKTKETSAWLAAVVRSITETLRLKGTTMHASEASLTLRKATILEPSWYELYKRTFDIVISAFLLVLLAPVMALTALAVRLSSPGPVIFRQERLSCRGKRFQILKFRTMTQNAESEGKAVFALDNDPRVTPLGAIMRKYRLDELPQLINVLRGEMSLIGPRPERPELAEQLVSELPRFMERLHVRPGITGLAQTTVGYASNRRSYRHKLAMDLIYIEKRCVLLDLWISLKTVSVILNGFGAR